MEGERWKGYNKDRRRKARDNKGERKEGEKMLGREWRRRERHGEN